MSAQGHPRRIYFIQLQQETQDTLQIYRGRVSYKSCLWDSQQVCVSKKGNVKVHSYISQACLLRITFNEFFFLSISDAQIQLVEIQNSRKEM